MDHIDFTGAPRHDRFPAIVAGTDPNAALHSIIVLVEGGIRLIEVSLTNPEADHFISQAVPEADTDAIVGAGTTIARDDASPARDAGARWTVTPLDDGFEQAVAMNLPMLAGALTPTDVAAAMCKGARAVNPFRASLGGPGCLRALRDPLSDVPFVPVGGVDASAASEYFTAGAVVVGVGALLVGDAPHGGDLASLQEQARAFRAVCQMGART